jgi:PRTase ComF-like
VVLRVVAGGRAVARPGIVAAVDVGAGMPVLVRVVSAFDVGAPAAPGPAPAEPVPTGRAPGASGRPPLDLVQFSRFKHGAVAPAWHFAHGLVERLLTEVPDTAFAPRLVVTASCYKYVPLASVTLADAVAHLLNARRAAAGVAPVTVTQFYRAQLIEGDYSTMSLDERQRFIEQDVIRVDAAVLAGAAVLVVDDLRITGFHEGRLAAVLDAAGVPEATFGYCAVIDGRADPTIERRLNQAAVGDLDALARLIDAGGFRLNSRVCKLILSAPGAELARFLDRLPLPLLDELVAGMECNGYAVMGRYRAAYESMRSILRARTNGEAA